MKILFIHQNMPGQYKHLARLLADDPSNQVAFITKDGKPDMPGVIKAAYKPSREPHPSTHHYLRQLEGHVLYGQGVVRAALGLRQRGFVPDVICAHTGWGEAMFIRDAFPDSPMLAYCEFYYRAVGADIGFDPEQAADVDKMARTRCRNAHMLIGMEAMDWGITPTRWQWSLHPEVFRERISVIHEGVDTDLCRPDPAATLTLPDGRVLSARDEVITYVARNLEPYRGFPTFMKALEEVCRRRPNAHVIIVGGDEVSYGTAPADAPNWREKMLAEVRIDPTRVHFLGRVPYDRFLSVLRISRAHVYLTYPFVLSWSMLEAMATGCLIIGSATAPVQEVIEDGRNGLLVDFWNPRAVADRLDEALDNPERMADLRAAARRTVQDRYDLRGVCIPAQMKLIGDVAARRRPTGFGAP
ncbi:glycosyltransferase family 4 protein [Azospirillum halopraeferens]|uniref:glycosyltransferase family 4 protein n=1 Tax=Azospirillum halopraeferens TaxID=34010 RepID=UPI000409274B|nr:glycosyltransferase family 4 protein [Azospirillum halopraeferens]